MKDATNKVSKNNKMANYILSPPSPDDVAGVAISTINKTPIYGVRESAEKGESGWYIWAGDFSNAADFFDPVHIKHIGDFFPTVEKYLSLPAGCKFIIDHDGYEDIWDEES